MCWFSNEQVAFPAEGDLGIGIKVDKDGLVVVSDVKQLKGVPLAPSGVGSTIPLCD